MSKQILDFDPQGMTGLHFFTENLNFPVVAASYNEWQETQLSYLEGNLAKSGHTTGSLCRWCQNHGIQFRIVYPLSFRSILRNPYKYMKFLQLKRKLNYSL